LLEKISPECTLNIPGIVDKCVLNKKVASVKMNLRVIEAS